VKTNKNIMPHTTEDENIPIIYENIPKFLRFMKTNVCNCNVNTYCGHGRKDFGIHRSKYSSKFPC